VSPHRWAVEEAAGDFQSGQLEDGEVLGVVLELLGLSHVEDVGVDVEQFEGVDEGQLGLGDVLDTGREWTCKRAGESRHAVFQRESTNQIAGGYLVGHGNQEGSKILVNLENQIGSKIVTTYGC
jgi:hypothetical protein